MGYGNQFCEEEHMSVQTVLKHAFDENATSSAKLAREIGFNQFDSFINDRLQNGTASLYDNITKNNLPLFRSKNTVVTSKLKQRIANLEADRRLYADLMATLITFLHMRIMPTLSEYGKFVRIWEIEKVFCKIRFSTMLR